MLVFDSLPSTNDLVAALSADPEQDGVVVLADHQTGGRGQFGRSWQSRHGVSVLMSILVRPPAELRRPVILTAWAAVGIAGVIYRLTGHQARIKWPNDILFHGRKVCGILIEQSTAVAVGIGLNVNQSAGDFADAGLPEATSLKLMDGQERDRLEVATAILLRLDEEYDRLLTGEVVPLESEWKWRIGLLGRQVQVELADRSTIAGRLHELTFDRLVLGNPLGSRVVRPEAVRHISAV
jgi:BirA family biotin operon repressor/biotin-[acetyl-CoA-carboxylase] ligase